MIVRAIERGVSEARLAEALGIDVAAVQRRARLMDGRAPAARLATWRDVALGIQFMLAKRNLEIAGGRSAQGATQRRGGRHNLR